MVLSLDEESNWYQIIESISRIPVKILSRKAMSQNTQQKYREWNRKSAVHLNFYFVFLNVLQLVFSFPAININTQRKAKRIPWHFNIFLCYVGLREIYSSLVWKLFLGIRPDSKISRVIKNFLQVCCLKWALLEFSGKAGPLWNRTGLNV